MPPSRHRWVIAAISAQILFAVSNFLVGAVGIEASEKASAGFSCAALRCLGCGVNSVLITGFLLIRGQTKLLSNTDVVQRIAISAGALLGAGEYVFSYGLASDGRNGAFISAVLPLNAILVAILSFGILQEHISVQQVAAMLLCVTGLVMMALSSASSGGLDGILFGAGSMLLFGCAFFCMKLAGARGGSIMGVIVFVWATYGSVGLIGMASMCVKENGNCFKGLATFEEDWDHGLPHRLVLFGIGSSIANALALGFTKLAFYSGPAGLVTAFVSSSSGIMFFFNFGFFRKDRYPTLELVGLGLCLAGVVLLGLLPHSAPNASATAGDREEDLLATVPECANEEDKEEEAEDVSLWGFAQALRGS